MERQISNFELDELISKNIEKGNLKVLSELVDGGYKLPEIDESNLLPRGGLRRLRSMENLLTEVRAPLRAFSSIFEKLGDINKIESQKDLRGIGRIMRTCAIKLDEANGIIDGIRHDSSFQKAVGLEN
jgi:hypothetical protein